MNDCQRIRRLLRYPIAVMMFKISSFLVRQCRQTGQDIRDWLRTTYPAYESIPEGKLRSFITSINSAPLAPWCELLSHLTTDVLQHRFNLLGSGPVDIHDGMVCAGLEGYRYSQVNPQRLNQANQRAAKRIRHMISSHYRPLDWHIDFRSGYRWRADALSHSVPYGHLPGVDIKMPWELARMQHLPWLALAYTAHKNHWTSVALNQLVMEFQDQILDFIAANPPRFGVNWRCTMDVGIRVANWLMAYDLFCASGVVFDAVFEQEFKRSIYAHGRHIVHHLEWLAELRSNHYLADIAGLLFVAAYLPPSNETQAWFVLASNELSKEISTQFQADGSHFEGSTHYHRLSAEMALYAIALAHVVQSECSVDFTEAWSQLSSLHGVLPNAVKIRAIHELTDPIFVDKLLKIANFTRSITCPDGSVVQIGDNDSGRFLKLTPDWVWSDEQQCLVHHVRHDALVSGIEAACYGLDSAPTSIDAWVIHALLKKPLCTAFSSLQTWGEGARRADEGILTHYLKLQAVQRLGCAISSLSYNPIHHAAFPDFGLYLYARPRLWLAVRCGSVGQHGQGGHAHNDQLSIALCFDNIPFIVDPGSYVYTSAPDLRNRFRSTCSHATLVASPGEQNGWESGVFGLFSMNRVAHARVIEANGNQFVGTHDGFMAPHTRSIAIQDTAIRVVDDCEAPDRFLVLPLAPGVHCATVILDGAVSTLQLSCSGVLVELKLAEGVITVVDSQYSAGYGLCEPTHALRINHIPPRCVWEIRVLD